MNMPEPITVDIAICTFRRPHIATTLASLSALQLPPGVTTRILVADNDDTPSAQGLVMATAAAHGLNVTYLHAPARNISIARNACLDAATADYLAMIDDDETVSPGWLAALLDCAKQSGAEAMLGPMQALYAADCPRWIRRGDYHSTRPVWVGGRILTGYTTNALIDLRSPLVAGLRFRLAFGVSGGEDTDYFTRLTRAGGRIAYAEAALSYEPVPAARANWRWLVRRRFRYGQTHGQLLRESGKNRTFMLLLAAAKTIACLCMLPIMPYRALLRGALHGGVVQYLCTSHTPQA